MADHQSSSEALLWPALQVGAFTGTSAVVIGSAFGSLYSSRPALFAFASGAQWFCLGSTFWATRSALLNSRGLQNAGSYDRILASGTAGGLSGGGLAVLMRGRRNVVPAVVMFTLFGMTGQIIYNRMDARHSKRASIDAPDSTASAWWRQLASKKWSPVEVLSDEQYESMLKEKLLRIDAEIAIVDDDLAKLKASGEREQGREAAA